jgi:hypothetical protein
MRCGTFRFDPLHVCAVASRRGGGGLAFAIIHSRAPSRFSVIRSSGSGTLDQAARQILMSLRLPPPSGDFFSASSSLNFRLAQ